MHETSESIPSLDCRADDWGAGGDSRRWRTSAQCSARALAVVMLDEDAENPIELERSEDQQPVAAGVGQSGTRFAYMLRPRRHGGPGTFSRVSAAREHADELGTAADGTILATVDGPHICPLGVAGPARARVSDPNCDVA